MSDFITNLVRRSTGLLPKTAVMPPLQSPFAPDVILTAPNQPPIAEKTAAMVMPEQKTTVPTSFVTGTTTPSRRQPEAMGTVTPQPPTPPAQIKPDKQPPVILSPRPQTVVASVVTPHEATATPISTAETKPIRKSTAPPPVQQEAQPHLSTMTKAQITPATSEIAATSTALHQKDKLTARNEQATTTPTVRPTLTASNYKSKTAVSDPPAPIPIIQPTPARQRSSPRVEAKISRPIKPATNPSTVEVHIGTVEVRASQPPTPTPPPIAPKPQGFGRYAQLRGGGERE